MKKGIFFWLTFGLIFFYSCRSYHNTTSAYNTFDVQYLGQHSSGKIILKIFAFGNNKEECIKNAKIEALKTVLFNGNYNTNDSRPLIGGANAAEKYKDVFNELIAEENLNKLVYLNSNGNIDKNERFLVKSNIGRKTNSSLKADRIKIGVELLVDKFNLIQTLNSYKINLN